MSRSRNGSGTVVQRLDGRWMGQLRLDGRRYTVYGKTKNEASDKLDELRREALLVGYLPTRQTLQQLCGRYAATPRTARYVHRTLHRALRVAMMCGHLPVESG